MGLYDVYEAKMGRRIASLENEFGAVRAGRASPTILDKVNVDYYGAPTPINQLAAVSVAEARILVITPWDKAALDLVYKAILASDIGINPTNDGNCIRLVFPQLTEERRKELVKEIHKIAEGSKVQIRNVRRDAIDDFKKQKKNNEITEDDLKDAETAIQKLTDKFIKTVDEILAKKEKEVMEI